ncbi:BadF/BadG/BcrA/BcrD ATPase family protein [Glaciihabitans sp. UYNi722]|uniref:N-acetylglucosamine kinase n=1 Tax=Glaciihabitans sp. UYNi722 TaxID=3156344 RepID=UPI003390FC56
MRKILAIDAGGTSTRAVVLDLSGRCLGYGRAGSGNPTAAGVEGAVAELAKAAERAVTSDGSATGQGSTALIALAGAVSPLLLERLAERFGALGFEGEPVIEPDLLGTYFSGTFGHEGYAIIAGTGAVAGRVTEGRLDFARGGTGWLLGDGGSGYWIGHQVVRAVVAALDGLGPDTALTLPLLASVNIETTSGSVRGRPNSLVSLMDATYALRPVDLARFAPLAFDALEDPVARGILTASATALADLLAATRAPDVDGPVVLGGSVLAAGMRVAPAIFAEPLEMAAGGAELIPVTDGVVGAAVLGLEHAGVDVDAQLFSRLRDDVARLQSAVPL